LAQFRAESGITKNDLILLCNHFITDSSRMEYSHRLDYVFFKPATAFDVRFSLEESKLWQYYLKYQDYFEESFAKNRNKTD